MSVDFHRLLAEAYRERYERVIKKVRWALEDAERKLSGKEDDPKDPIWERRKRRLWNYGMWDVDLSSTLSHMPTAVKVLRWILQVMEKERLKGNGET